MTALTVARAALPIILPLGRDAGLRAFPRLIGGPPPGPSQQSRAGQSVTLPLWAVFINDNRVNFVSPFPLLGHSWERAPPSR